MTPQLNTPLVLEGHERIPDGSGGFIEQWIELGTLWVELRARTGRDTDSAEAHVSQTGYRITLRAAPLGAPSRPIAGQRFRDGTRLLRITSVAEMDASKRYLTCFAEEEIAL